MQRLGQRRGAPPLITCNVDITNNVSAETPGARTVTAATVNQCVGSGTGGGNYGAFPALVCDPYPATTTNATVTQCNGSVTGGGSTANCSVASSSVIRRLSRNLLDLRWRSPA